MNIIKQGDEKVIRIIKKKQLNAEAQYRLSTFAYTYSENGRYFIYNTLIYEMAELTEAEWNAVQQIKSAPVSYEFIAANRLEALAASRYIVETDHDDAKQYTDTVFLLKTIAGRTKGLHSYTILPTTACNARCVYCYEEGYAVKTMTGDIADRLVDFICETRRDGRITLRWFGGEPLAGADIISRICTSLQQRGVEYKSEMVTNASLMTKEMAHEAKELWHLSSVQVSLDGAEKDYTLRKRYIDPVKYNYGVVMKAVHSLADEGIKVRLRVNVDRGNIGRIEGFLKDIKAEFGDMENIMLYIAPLFQEMHTEHGLGLTDEINRLTDLQRDMGIPASLVADPDHKGIHLRTNYCMADNIDGSIVITPDGTFNNCEHLPEDQTWGNIFDGVTDKAKLEQLGRTAAVDEKCAKCPFLPQCTPFYKNGCPGWIERCYEVNCLKQDHLMHNIINGVKAVQDDEDENDI